MGLRQFLLIQRRIRFVVDESECREFQILHAVQDHQLFGLQVVEEEFTAEHLRVCDEALVFLLHDGFHEVVILGKVERELVGLG